MKKLIEKKIIIIFIVMIIIFFTAILLLIILNKNKTKIYEINKNNFSLKYDNTWKIEKEDENEINFIHKKSGSKFNVKINEIEEEYQYKTLDEISDSLLYNLREQNPNYKLIQDEKTQVTKNNFEAYKLLFETDNSQAEICYYKQGNSIVMFTYEAKFEYFDILLDSVNSIINDFVLNEEKFDVKTSINLNTTGINYTEQNDISNLLNNTTDYEIAGSNYLVNYSIPSNFKLTELNTIYGNYNFENLQLGTSINLRTSILNASLYEYLDKEDTPNLYENYNLNSYNESNEELDKFGDTPLSYIYKNSYLNNNKLTENIAIVYELNKNHILIIRISSEGVGIPEELVKMIKINKIENIASNIKIEQEDGFLIGRLKRFIDYTYEKIEEITLRLPLEYQEIDKENNLYEKRNYVLNYNEEKEIYDYEVSFEIIEFDINSKIDSLNKEIDYYKDNGEYKEFSKSEDILSNNKQFQVYDSSYTRNK